MPVPPVFNSPSEAAAFVLRILGRQFTPHQIVDWLEHSVTEGRLSRRDANRVQEGILEHLDRDGKWK